MEWLHCRPIVMCRPAAIRHWRLRVLGSQWDWSDAIPRRPS